ncbi:putative nwd2 protein [Mycena sanguinolenta]|uniref:Putative nwd2 protein n=1 Tax=Mycena sanguinolenta TaxID=230812 RepID=A0A8H6XN96_9AGAR|nr:putative nwd2 protein [Mycena sanguinolenta]
MFPGAQTMNNYINGGRGGEGGQGHGSGTGGAGGHGMGPSVKFDIRPGGNFTMNNNVRQGERGIDILHHMVALEAIHDSAESYPQPRCHPETRTKMLEDLQEWALAPDPESTVLWLHGPAGAGKSAIMQSLAGQLQGIERLGSSFFFKRGHATRGNGKMLFATIAYQLALSVPWLRAPISQTIENDPSIVARSMKTQMRKLISQPCRPHGYRDPVTVLIDGLDECDGHGAQEDILRIISNPPSRHAIPLRFIVASRPEPHICEMFASHLYSGHYRSVNVEQSFADVRKYLRNEFLRIHQGHSTMGKIPLPWPDPDVLEELVENSSGHFIYASTVIKFVDDKNYRPTERLAVVQDPNSSGSESAFDPLDQLYMTILSSAPRQSQLIPILCAIVHFPLAADDIDQFLGLAEGETRLRLRGLHSVLDVPSDNKEGISSHHASFIDFLKHPNRSGDFCVGTLDHRISLARSFLQFYAGPFQRHRISTLSHLIRFIISFPASGAVAELFSLIGSVNPHYIFDPLANLYTGNLASIASWLKNAPSPPTDLIQLWEDYAFMFFIDIMNRGGTRLSVKHNVSPSPELLRILVSMKLLGRRLWELPTTLDLTWTSIRTTLCSLRPKLAKNERASLIHQPQAAYPGAARDLALQLIRKMVKHHADTNGGANPSASRDAVWVCNAYSRIRNLEELKEAYIKSQYDLACDISCLVRLAPPCPVLYRELWSIPPSEIWSSQPSGKTLIHHVSKWLKSFPDSTMELITFWEQAGPDSKHHRDMIFNPGQEVEEEDWCVYVPESDWFVEDRWHDGVRRYNDTVVKLHLPKSLEIIV